MIPESRVLKLVSLNRGCILDTSCYYDPTLKIPKGNAAMSRIFAYCRVSTSEQNTKNQVIEIKNNGYDINDDRVVEETISGGVNAMERPAFKAMVKYSLELGDTLIVLKLDRLGRDNIDVQQTITMLTNKGIKVVSLDLPTRDLTSPEGKLMLQMFSAFAEFEKSRIRERTMEGLAKAKADGTKLGRPAFNKLHQLRSMKAQGLSQSQVKKTLGVSIATVKRHWNK